MPATALTLKARVVQHNTKSETKDGVDILKVSLEVENTVGSELVRTPMTFALRSEEDSIDRYPLDEQFEITIKPATKS